MDELQLYKNLLKDFLQQNDLLPDTVFDNDAFVEFADNEFDFSKNKWSRKLKENNIADFASMFDFFTTWLNIDDSKEELVTLTSNLNHLVQQPKTALYRNDNWKPTDDLNNLQPLTIKELVDRLS